MATDAIEFELPVEAGPNPSKDGLVRAFAAAHEQRYGFEVPDAPVELVAIRVALSEPAPEPRPKAAPDAPLERTGRFSEGRAS